METSFFVQYLDKIGLKPFQLRAAFHIETSHLICNAYQMTGFYMKSITGLKWVKCLNINN